MTRAGSRESSCGHSNIRMVLLCKEGGATSSYPAFCIACMPRAGAGMELFKFSENLALCAYIYIGHHLWI
jgi:hypothetical protein